MQPQVTTDPATSATEPTRQQEADCMPTPFGDLHWTATARGAEPQTEGFSGSPRRREVRPVPGQEPVPPWEAGPTSRPPLSPGGACLVRMEQPLCSWLWGPSSALGPCGRHEHKPQARPCGISGPRVAMLKAKGAGGTKPDAPLHPETSTTLLGRHRSPPGPTQVTLHAHRQCSPAARSARGVRREPGVTAYLDPTLTPCSFPG